MKKPEILEKLQKIVDIRCLAHINREELDQDAINCIPLILGRDLLLLQYLYDFQLDGYMIIRIKDITSIRSGDIEKFSQFILKEEGILCQVKKPSISNLDGWKAVFEELKNLGTNIIIESESIKEEEFYIGKIININNNSVLLLCFDAVGEWDKEVSEILYKDITLVSFDNKYLNTISKYVNNKTVSDFSYLSYDPKCKL